MAARRSARNSLVLHKAQEGVKGGTLAGGPPFAGGPRRPQPLRRRGAGGERREGTSRTPSPTGLVRRHGVCGYPTPGRGSAERGGAGKNRDGGTSRTPSPTGRLRRRGAGDNPAPGGGGTSHLRGLEERDTAEIKNAPIGGVFHFAGVLFN